MIRMVPAALALLALSVSGAAQDDVPLFGKWVVAEAMPAPWVNDGQRKSAEAFAKQLLNLEIEYKAREVTSKNKTIACRRARYEVTTYPVDALFQGMLPEPNQERVAINMGFPRGDVAGVDLRCTSGAFSYHFKDRDTAMFAFNNVISTIKRR